MTNLDHVVSCEIGLALLRGCVTEAIDLVNEMDAPEIGVAQINEWKERYDSKEGQGDA